MKQNIGSILRDEFNQRKRKNDAYSLRAFSRDLNVSVSFLSDVLSGKKTPSTDKALAISEAIGWSWREKQIFLQTAQLNQAKNRKTKEFLQEEIKKTQAIYHPFKPMKSHMFSSLAEWYLLAIMEMTALPGFNPTGEWLAPRLGISKELAQKAAAHLKAKEYIWQDDDGAWHCNSHSLQDTPSAHWRKFHQQHLANASVALEKQDFNKRHLSGITMAINSEKMPEALELIREFRSRMNLLLADGPKDSVYHLAIQLFQLDHGLTQEKLS